jgi:hypothetical protein
VGQDAGVPGSVLARQLLAPAQRGAQQAWGAPLQRVAPAAAPGATPVRPAPAAAPNPIHQLIAQHLTAMRAPTATAARRQGPPPGPSIAEGKPGSVQAQKAFGAYLAADTGLSTAVVGKWLAAEQPEGSPAKPGSNDWLNVETGLGPGSGVGSASEAAVGHLSASAAARATAQWIRQNQPEILSANGKGVAAEAAAIENSNFASSHYGGKLAATAGYSIPSAGNIRATAASASAGAPAQPGVLSASTTTSSGGPTAPELKEALEAVKALSAPAIMAAEGSPARPSFAAGPTLPEGSRAPAPLTQASGTASAEKLLEHVLGATSTNVEAKVKSTPAEDASAGDPQLSGPSSGQKAVQFGVKSIGKYAESEGNNLGPELNKLEKTFGDKGEPWCAIFATTAAAQGGASKAARTASVAQINQWAQEGSHGYEKGLLPSSKAQPGDLLTFGDAHVALVKEVRGGTIYTIEGNADGSGGVVQLTHKVGEGQIVRPRY